MKAPEELKRLYQEGRLVPFIGAGVSRSVEWRNAGERRTGVLWRELVNQAAKQLGFEDPDLLRARGTDLQILEYYQLKKETLAPLSNWLYGQMQPDDDALRGSAIHRALCDLVSCRILYTTNYDDFVERAFRIHGRPIVEIAIESHMARRVEDGQSVAEVVKFHGDFNHPQWMVITESDYQRRLAFETPMDLRFRADMLGRAILFLGYSFNDPNVAYLFHHVNETLSTLPSSLSGRRAYITVADPSDFERALFAARNIEVIPVRERTQAADIAALLDDLRG